MARRVVVQEHTLFDGDRFAVVGGLKPKLCDSEEAARKKAVAANKASAWARFQALEVFEGRHRPSKRELTKMPLLAERWAKFVAAESVAGRI